MNSTKPVAISKPKSKTKKPMDRMTAFDYINYIIIAVLCIIFLYPVLYTLGISLSDPRALLNEKLYLFPKGFSLEAYRYLISDDRILRYYMNSVIYAVGGAAVHLLLTAMMAFPLVINTFKGKKFLSIYMTITMFFGGGLVPYYFVVRAVGLVDSRWVYIIPGAVSAYTVMVFRTFFNSIPDSLIDAAQIDGAGYYRILFQIVLPVSKPLLATFGLMSLVGKWNDYFTAQLFLRDQSLFPIQTLLRRMLVLVDFQDVANRDAQLMMSLFNPRTVKSAAVIITILPIMAVYPFLQKYFAKGVMVGSLKA